ncbi:MAG: hypothetical protein E7673_02065 [Ruminococcaceae bacterium]|nr:hypothetical protein [Oscillospiraceae bacterium]
MSWLEEKYKKGLTKNEADSYFEYASKSGIRAADKLSDSIVDANTTRALTGSDYGVNADRLHSSGLNASGYEDYLKRQSSKAFHKTLNDAYFTRRVDEYENKLGYKGYLSDYEALQTQMSETLIEEISKGTNFNVEHAYKKALDAGIAKNLAYVTAETGVEMAIDNTVKKAVQYAKENNLSPEKARDYASELGLDEINAERVFEEISAMPEKEKSFYANMSPSDYYNYIKSHSK